MCFISESFPTKSKEFSMMYGSGINRYYQLCGELSGMWETQYSHVKCTVNKTKSSLRKQTSFHSASTGFPAKSHLRNGWRDSILLTCYSPDLGSASDWLLHKICFMQIYPDLGSTSDWLCLEICLKQIRSTTQICSHSSDVISWGN